METVLNEIFEALGYLFIAYIVLCIWKEACERMKEEKLKEVLWKGFLYCGAIALFTSIILGNPTCESQDSDPFYSRCEQYADDGYEPTTEQRVANFAYFMTLLYVPAIVGAFKGKKVKSLQ